MNDGGDVRRPRVIHQWTRDSVRFIPKKGKSFEIAIRSIDRARESKNKEKRKKKVDRRLFMTV